MSGYTVDVMTLIEGDRALLATTHVPDLDAARTWSEDHLPEHPAERVWVVATQTIILPTGDHAPMNASDNAWLCALTPSGHLTSWVPTQRAHPSYGVI